MTTTVNGIGELEGLVGQHLGYSDWLTVDQERINLFADATGDHQWIHVDPERAASGPFGTAIAHGYLTLSLLPFLLQQVWQVQGMTFGVNYGCNKVRFPAPVKVDSRIRAGATVASVEDVGGGGVQVILDVAIETETATEPGKPNCVAQVVYRYYA